jgi:hypothetical protein
MTKATNGAYPFNGDAGGSGDWQMHPAADLFDEFSCRFDAAAVKARLEWIDEEMYKGWHDLELVSAQSSQGGGTGFGDMVGDFINHVRLLSEDDTHLYSAFPQPMHGSQLFDRPPNPTHAPDHISIEFGRPTVSPAVFFTI